MEEPIWVNQRLVQAIHNRQIAEHGGLDGIRDQSLLESAMDRLRNRFYYNRLGTDLPELAAAYAYGIARNHPFMDGNKRTAYVASRTFLVLNSWDLVGPLSERYSVFMALAGGEINESELAGWVRSHARPEGTHEPFTAYDSS